ncbi:TPA: hypothetical protein NIF13_001229 [Pseudomonas aeruginosa]|uniref:hypothetical protein n=1 Tax=Pseudomonas aeruginosa TaxID=287 RepID=UPI0019061CCE|nr:hypothetical protein [Pseudomonas aeruginosa]MDI2459410.1 hypothetical protein [Pseudomonas aeruginosa]QQM09461.1 hypothetical protein LYSZa7_00930 [Pseudomonas aeruginosa]HBO4310576.1 hypothetical protein [Pseudomonas aeruginosa]HBO4703170.1 hypothetical protein [Pseudomonas aeruginosa]HCF4396921.1 hypothetical protein [Pseudomonas aeruginosa]
MALDINISGPYQRTLPGGQTLTFARGYDFDGVWMRYWETHTADSPYRIDNLTYDEYEEYRQQHPELNMPELKLPPPATNPQGNTLGRAIGEQPAEGASAEESNEEIEDDSSGYVEEDSDEQDETDEEYAGAGLSGEDIASTAVEVLSHVPGANIPIAGVKAAHSLMNGDVAGALMHTAEMIPFAKWIGTAVKLGKVAGKVARTRRTKPPKPPSGAKGKGKKKPDPCKALESGIPGSEYRGGKHGAIKKGGYSYNPKRESHHIPAKSAYSKVNGKAVNNDMKPSIQMDIEDHKKTASWGRSAEAQDYQKEQRQLIQGGKAGYMAAMTMDILDIRENFGDKYDEAIAQMIAWAKCKGYI